MHRSIQSRESEQLYINIWQMITHHRKQFFNEHEGMRIFLSLSDARSLDEHSKQQGDFFPASQIQDGDNATIFGFPVTVDATIPIGRAYLGYRAVAAPVI